MAPSRGLVRLIKSPSNAFVCRQCSLRAFSTSSSAPSGHSRWSKIKHDKAKVDASKNRQRSIFAHEIATASKLYGPDPNANPRLADLITKAKREGFAKTSIEAAIARGQGRSTSGSTLENVTIEGILPNNVAVIVDCETDNKLRTLADVRLVLKENGGSSTPTSYLFTKKGRIVFEGKEGIGPDDLLEPALEAGALDVTEDEHGRPVVFAEPSETRAVGDAISKALDLQIASSDVIWDPNEDTKVSVPTEDAVSELGIFIDELHEAESTVQSIAMNLAVPGSGATDSWKELQDRLSH